ncbi:hypothetical protein CEXT_89631 [Caerostris extrusa]|uniref:Uncharacterized protein n=1 Tax=Caerostris extrusa TaxID=172846 RepID=A0AAV4Y996_CAEEX|nr:hypothetical protein CEXT_89631 [Caerostris extrusa]
MALRYRKKPRSLLSQNSRSGNPFPNVGLTTEKRKPPSTISPVPKNKLSQDANPLSQAQRNDIPVNGFAVLNPGKDEEDHMFGFSTGTINMKPRVKPQPPAGVSEPKGLQNSTRH